MTVYYPVVERKVNSTNLDDFLSFNKSIVCFCGAQFYPICLTASGSNIVTCKGLAGDGKTRLRHRSALTFHDGPEGVIKATTVDE